MFQAVEIGSEVSVAMPPDEFDKMYSSIMTLNTGLQKAQRSGGIQELWKVLESIAVEEAQASVEEDRVRIMTMIDTELDKGSVTLNRKIIGFLKEWLIGESEHLVAAEDATPQVCQAVSLLLKQFGYLDRAVELLVCARKKREDKGQLHTLEGVSTLALLAHLRLHQGQIDGALEVCEEALLAPGVAEWPHEHSSVIFAKGRARFFRGELDQAIADYSCAKQIRVEAGFEMEPETAELMMMCGLARLGQADLDGAESEFGNAMRILEELKEVESPTGAMLMAAMSNVNRARGDMDGAVELLNRAKHIRRATDTMDTHEGALLLADLGWINFGQKDLGTAKKLFDQARQIRVDTNTLAGHDGAIVLVGCGLTKSFLNGDLEGALEDFYEAKQIRMDTNTMNTPDGEGVVKCIEDTEKAIQDKANVEAGSAASQ